MKSLKNLLFSLCDEYTIGSVGTAADIAYDELSEYCDTEKSGNTVIGRIMGSSDYTLMLDAHIDEVGFVVTDIDSEGFLTLKNAGGIDPRILPASEAVIHSKEKIRGIFCATPPHLMSGERLYDNVADIKLDSTLGKRAEDIISLGDFVTFCPDSASLLGNRVAAKSLDDRAGVVCLIELARRLKDKDLPINIVFLISDMEELGLRGAKTAGFRLDPDEAVAIDVSFGAAPDVLPCEGGALGGGAMIGISPALDSSVSRALINTAIKNGISYQQEIMSGTTGTNADAIAVNRCGVKTGLISIPLRNMHTPHEIIDMEDILSACDILEKYILEGGVKND